MGLVGTQKQAARGCSRLVRIWKKIGSLTSLKGTGREDGTDGDIVIGTSMALMVVVQAVR